MANKAKKSAADNDANVVRIKATGNPSKKQKDAKAAAPAEVVAAKPAKTKTKTLHSVKAWKRPFIATGRYFKGAWFELRQVRWPNRRATWSLTGAVMAYTAFFAILILLLDAGFKYMFEVILGK